MFSEHAAVQPALLSQTFARYADPVTACDSVVTHSSSPQRMYVYLQLAVHPDGAAPVS